MTELVYVDGGKTAALVVGRNDDGSLDVVKVGKVEKLHPDENGSLDVADLHVADKPATKVKTPAKV